MRKRHPEVGDPRDIKLSAGPEVESPFTAPPDAVTDHIGRVASRAADPNFHNRLPKKEREGFFSKTRNKILTIIAGVAIGSSVAGGTVAALNNSHEAPASAPVDPGAGDHAPQTPEQKLTIKDYPYEVNGKTYEGFAALEKAIAVPGEKEDGSEAFSKPEDVLKAYLEALTKWVNSGSSPEEKQKRASYVAKSGNRGALGTSEDFYDPACERILITTPAKALNPNAASNADDGIQYPKQLVGTVKEYHKSALNHDDIQTTFESQGNIDVLAVLQDPNLKTASDGRVNHIAGQLDKVALMEQGIDVVNGETWNLTLWRVPNESGLGTHWAAANSHATSN